MADEKKPRINLKDRLKSAGGGLTPPPPIAGGIPMPAPAATPMPGGVGNPAAAPIATPAPRQGGLPVPLGIPVGPPPAFKSSPMNLDPSNPLSAAMQQPAPQRRSVPPPQPQRIEIDELSIQEARKGARKQGIIAGLVAGVVLGAIGYIAGGAQETNKGRSQSVAHAKALAGDVEKSQEQLKALADKLEAGRNTLGKDKKFPDTLARDLGAINIDFDGSKLAGIRFSGFSTETTSGLIEYISAVQATNDRKNALIGLLSKLQKPMTEQLTAAAANKPPSVSFVVLINRDGAKNPYAILAPLQKPIELSAGMPAEFTATDTTSPGRPVVTAPKFASLDKPGAAYVVPKSIEAACPSETSGQIGQLVGQLSRLITDVRGEAAAPAEAAGAVLDSKPGLLERAALLDAGLKRVQ